MYIFTTLTALTFQPPPPCPANYIPRVEIIDEISKIIVEDTSDANSAISIGTTVIIRGIGGIGKSTLAKALCYHPLIKKYFTHGFLWISLSPPRLSPEAMLRNMYNKLTNSTDDCNFLLLKDRIRILFTSIPCKLLVILDDVVDADDVTEYVEVFSTCKIVITTRKNDINLTIPPKRCFEIGPMKAFEAVQLLTWKIGQLTALNTSDAEKIQQLAKDLYYWPLLLNLVRGQLYIHCAEWKESPTSAIFYVQQKLQNKGLTAFDPHHIKKETAVKASINASLELLFNNEKCMLFHVVTAIGIGSCVLKSCIFKLSKINSDEFDNLIKNLWSHGLVSVGKIVPPFHTDTLPCIEIHDVIAQYIIEEMPYDYHLFLNKVSIDDHWDCFFSVYIFNDAVVKAAKLSVIVDLIDVFMIPFSIRTLAVLTRARQVDLSKALNILIENCSDILKTNALIKFFKTKQPLSQIYGSVKENCRLMQSMLTDNRYNEAATWLTEYTDNHPFALLMESIQTLKNELTDEYKHNPKLLKLINDTIGIYCLTYDAKGMGKRLSSMVHCRRIISEMINTGATSDEITEVFCMSIGNIDSYKYF